MPHGDPARPQEKELYRSSGQAAWYNLYLRILLGEDL